MTIEHSSHITFTPLQNFKGFASSRPPLVVFLVCLITFAITAASLAYFVRRSDLRNPDITVDWNIVLESFAKLDICVNHNGSLPKPVAAVATRDVSAHSGTTSGVDATSYATDMSTVDSSLSSVDDFKTELELAGNQTVSFEVELKFSPEIHSLPRNITYVSGTVCGKLLGLTGENSQRDIPVSFELPSERKFSDCDERRGCYPPQKVCMTFHGLPKLPATGKLTKCSSELSAAVSQPNQTLFTTEPCPVDQWSAETDLERVICHGTSLHVVYETNPELTIMLSERDRTLINLHLMYTSYFLLVMVMTLLCYAIIRGRPKSKALLLSEKVLLEH